MSLEINTTSSSKTNSSQMSPPLITTSKPIGNQSKDTDAFIQGDSLKPLNTIPMGSLEIGDPILEDLIAENIPPGISDSEIQDLKNDLQTPKRIVCIGELCLYPLDKDRVVVLSDTQKKTNYLKILLPTVDYNKYTTPMRSNTNSFDDYTINQAAIGDCYYLAALQAAIDSDDPEVLMRILENIDVSPKGEYQMTLIHTPEQNQYSVSLDTLMKDARNHSLLPNGRRELADSSTTSGAYFPAFMENILKQHAENTGWEVEYDIIAGTSKYDIINEGFGITASELLLGVNQHNVFLKNDLSSAADDAEFIAQLKDSLEEGNFIFIHALYGPKTRNRDAEQDGKFVRYHEYIIDSIDSNGDFIIKNPWGITHTYTEQEVLSFFDGSHIYSPEGSMNSESIDNLR